MEVDLGRLTPSERFGLDVLLRLFRGRIKMKDTGMGNSALVFRLSELRCRMNSRGPDLQDLTVETGLNGHITLSTGDPESAHRMRVDFSEPPPDGDHSRHRRVFPPDWAV